jgi:Recombinase
MIKKLSACPGWLGLSEDGTSFIFIPERAEIVRRIYEASIARLGGYTKATQLNARNVPPFGPSGKWDQSTIHNLLRNRATICATERRSESINQNNIATEKSFQSEIPFPVTTLLSSTTASFKRLK